MPPTYSDLVISIGLGSTSVFPRRLSDAFRLAAEAGYDGVEIMVTSDPDTRDPRVISALSERYGMPVLSIHAPVLVLTTFVYGLNPHVKLDRSAELARQVGAPTVVVHPPFRWQVLSARRFESSVRELEARHGVMIAVENMFPVTVRGRDREAYAPSWNSGDLAVDALTLDFSHAALAGVSALDLAHSWGDRLRHVHLCDGSSTEPNDRIIDEHLLPGHGAQPVAEVLQLLAERGFTGSLIAEISTRSCGSDDVARLALLRETVEFARRHTARARVSQPVGASGRVPQPVGASA